MAEERRVQKTVMAEQVICVERGKLLIGAKAIMDEYGLSEYMFSYWIERGMPAKLEAGRWHAHTTNIDTFFRAVTLTMKRQKVPPQTTKD